MYRCPKGTVSPLYSLNYDTPVKRMDVKKNTFTYFLSNILEHKNPLTIRLIQDEND